MTFRYAADKRNIAFHSIREFNPNSKTRIDDHFLFNKLFCPDRIKNRNGD